MVDSLSEEVPVIFLAKEVLDVVLTEEGPGVVLAKEVLTGVAGLAGEVVGEVAG